MVRKISDIDYSAVNESSAVESIENSKAVEKKPADNGGAVVTEDKMVLKVLEKFKDFEEIYIDKIGCVYTPNTPKSIVGNAVLYKNPYFNK